MTARPLPHAATRAGWFRSPLLTGGLLLALASASYGLSFLKLGAYGLAVALLVALLKACLVLFAFMGFGKQSASVKFAALAALFMLLLLAGLMAADGVTRAPPPRAPELVLEPAQT